MNEREKEIAAVAAAVAAGCVKCLQYHKKKALENGLTEDDLLMIARLAFVIRNKADQFNRGELDEILTGDEIDGEQPLLTRKSDSSCC